MSRRLVVALQTEGNLAREGLFDPNSPRNRDNVLMPWRRLREAAWLRGWQLAIFDAASEPDVVISVDSMVAEPTAPWILIVHESPAVRPDLYQRASPILAGAELVLTQSAKLAAEFSKFQYRSIPIVLPDALVDGSPERSGFMVMMNANKGPTLKLQALKQELYTKRLRVAAELARRGSLDVYGPGWHRTLRFFYRNPIWTRRVRDCWRGVAESKLETLTRYEFCLAFENAAHPGYITEKAFDSMAAGCIPVYLGAPDVADILPTLTFVDYRDYGSPRRLFEDLETMSDEEKNDRRHAMSEYLRSSAFESRFGVNGWVDDILKAIESILGTNESVQRGMTGAS